MASAGSLWVEIIPKIVGATTAIREEVVPAATAAGTQAGAEIGKGVADGAKAGAMEASATIRATMLESAKLSGSEASAVLAQSMTGSFAKQLASELSAAEKAVTDSALRMQAAQAKAAAAADQVAVAEARLAEARQKYAADSSQVVAAEARLADAERKSALAADGATASTKAHDAAQGEYVVARNKVAEAETAGTLKTAEAEAAQTKLGNSFKSLVPGLGNLSKGYAALGSVIGVAIVAGMGEKAVSAAAEFQSSQERLVTTAGELQSNLKLVDDGILKMAGDVGISAQELSKGMYTVESAGFHGADALTVMKAAAQGAKEENADLTVVTDAVTSAMQDYHLKADDAALVTSRLITAVSDGKSTFQDMTGAMSAVLPVASSVGISMEEILGDLSSMTLHGMSADQASQNLANAIRSLANPTLAATKELAALGINAADLSKNLGQTGVQGTMEQISQAILQKMGPAGTTLLNAFNQSKQAAADAATMFANLPPQLKQIAQDFSNGKISMNEWRQGLKSLPADQAALLQQWVTVQNSANGFSDALKTGGNAAQTYTQALAKATGNSTSMNVALMLTGENAAKTKENIADVSAATTEAGNNTKGWAHVQETFNQKMSEAKAAVGSLGISIGNVLLPVFSKLAGIFSDVVGWMAKHQTVSTIVIVAFGGIAVAIGIATLAMLAFNSAVWSNPVTWIIAGIIVAVAALAVGIYELVTHWKQIWAAIETALKAAYNATLKPVFDAIGTAAKAIGTAFQWLWENVLSPVFNAISVAVRVLFAIFFTVLILPTVLIIKNILAPAFTWLYDNVIKPVFELIGNIFSWLYNNVVRPIFNAIADVFTWLYDHVIKIVVDAIKIEIDAWGQAFQWLYDHVIKPVGDAVGAVFNWMYDHVIKPIVAGIKAEIDAWGQVFQWLYDNIIKPVGDAIGAAFHGIGQGVSNVVDWIKSTWSTIKDIVEAPAKFVVQTVYDDAIVPVWNAIAGVFDLGKISPVDVSNWAGGGIIPGYAPGVDSVPAMLSPGEAVLTPEAARMLGYGNILKLNAMSGRAPGNETNGMPIHASGGFFDWVGDAASGVGHFVSNVAGSIWDGLKTAAGWVSQGVQAVTGNVTALFGGAQDAANGTPGHSQFRDGLTHLPAKVIKSAIDAIKSWFSSNAASFGGGVIPDGQHLAILQAALTADGIPTGDWPKWLSGLNTLITRESGWNAGAINNWDSNAAAGHPSQGLMQEIPGTFNAYRNPALPGGILDPVANVAAGIRYILARYGDITNVQQANANMPPKGYDSGGWLEPGITKVVNASGKPEPVFTNDQWQIIKQNVARGSGGGDTIYNITSHDPTSVVHEIKRREHHEMLSQLV